MIIRSQDKTMITNFHRVTDIVISYENENATDITACLVGGGRSHLGTYSTVEKAIKVLDMIQNKYFEHMTVEKNGAIFNVLEQPKVFKMPQDSEV